jgi:hypothetical protein
MTNADQGGAVMAELSRRIQRAYDWDAVAEPAPRGYRPPPARTAITLPEETLRDYVGTYQAPEMSIVVTLGAAGLQIEPEGQERLTLHAESEDAFFLRAIDVQVTFNRDEAGDVTGLVVQQGGREIPADRVR